MALQRLRPVRRNDGSGRPCAPIEAGEDGFLDIQRIHQGDDIDGDCRGLAVANRFVRKETRRAIAAQIRNDHPLAGLRQRRRDIDKAMNIIGPAVQKNDRGTIGGTGFGVSDIEDAGINLFQRGERRVRPRLDRRQRGLLRLGLRLGGPHHAKLGRGKAHRRSRKKATPMAVDWVLRSDAAHPSFSLGPTAGRSDAAWDSWQQCRHVRALSHSTADKTRGI